MFERLAPSGGLKPRESGDGGGGWVNADTSSSEKNAWMDAANTDSQGPLSAELCVCFIRGK